MLNSAMQSDTYHIKSVFRWHVYMCTLARRLRYDSRAAMEPINVLWSLNFSSRPQAVVCPSSQYGQNIQLQNGYVHCIT